VDTEAASTKNTPESGRSTPRTDVAGSANVSPSDDSRHPSTPQPGTGGASGTPASQPQPDRRTFEARLPNGVGVELLGVSEHPSKETSWWRPDGSPLTKPPCDPLKGSVDGGADHVAREFAVQWHNLPAEPVGTQVLFDPPYNAYAGAQPKRLGQDVAGLEAMTVSLPDRQTVTVRVRVAAGLWQTVVESESGSMSMGTMKGGFTFSPVEEKGGRVTITVTHDILGPESRVVAVGRDGREHRASASSGGGASSFRQITATFSKLTLKDIKVFRVQTRPYEQAEFRNVSLRPGQKTDVKVVQLGTPLPGTGGASGTPVHAKATAESEERDGRAALHKEGPGKPTKAVYLGGYLVTDADLKHLEGSVQPPIAEPGAKRRDRRGTRASQKIDQPPITEPGGDESDRRRARASQRIDQTRHAGPMGYQGD